MATKEEIQAEITSALVELFALDPASIGPSSRLVEDLDLDSIDALDMVVELQSLLRGRIDERDMKGLRTVADVVDMVEQQLQRSPVASAS